MGRRAPARRPLSGLPRARESGADAGIGGGGGALAGPDPGFFGPASVTWRLDREAFLLLGAGPRALLLQIAHPAVAAGVAEHSDFRADPWARLAGTLRSYLRIVYGTTAEARMEIRRLNGLHRDVRGVLDGGGTYAARDPELALWVHATLVDSTIAAADAWLEPLDRAARTRVYEESLPVGRAFGISDALLPADLEGFETYVASMLGAGGPVRPGPLARELAAAILNPPAGPPVRTLAGAAAGLVPEPWLQRAVVVAEHVPPAALGWLLWPAIGLLPAGVREAYGFRWGPVERGVATWLVASWRAWNAVLPPAVRWMPQARAADRRMRGG